MCCLFVFRSYIEYSEQFGVRQPCKVMGGYWYPPRLNRRWSNRIKRKPRRDRPRRRRALRNQRGSGPTSGTPAAQQYAQEGRGRQHATRHARWAGTEDGEVSSDGQSSVMSKVARKVGRMGWGSSAAHGNERGPDDLC